MRNKVSKIGFSAILIHALGTAAAQEAVDSAPLEEVTVTAQKREERLQDVPVPVTVLDASSLVERNQVHLQDYYSSIPGLSLSRSDGLGSSPQLSIRGLTTGGGNPTVGITVDDVPYGTSSSLGGGGTVPDFDPGDLAQIEVLRGPQGTLYGASSIGGLLKFVTVDPSTQMLSGRIQGDVMGVHNGDGASYGVRGSVNVPLGENFAIRASAFGRRDAGYIDNSTLGLDGLNQSSASGGRLSAKWTLSDTLSLKLSALLQDTKTEGSALIFREPGLGDLEQRQVLGTGRSHVKFQVFSATLNARIANADLTSVSGYSINTVASSNDQTPVYGGLTQFLFGVEGAANIEDNRTTKVSQELRLSMPFGERVDWLVGVFFTDEKNRYKQALPAIDPATGEQAGSVLLASFPTTYKEYAAFTDLTFRITDRFDVQIGGREGKNRQTYEEIDSGPLIDLFLGGSPLVNPRVLTKDSSFTYLLTPRFRFSPDLMVYARLASGYRSGGPNPTSTVFGLPPSFQPDKTVNYEIGFKGAVLDHALSFDASVYYVDWKDIQLSLNDPTTGASFFANASRASSKGVELSLQARPLSGLTLGAWTSWNDAKLTEDLPPGGPGTPIGGSGERLPSSARFSGGVSADQRVPLTEQVTGFIGGSLSYIGDRKGRFTAAGGRQELPAYARLDLHAGATFEEWTANLFANNLLDRRGLIAGGLGTAFPTGFYYIQPRTVGLSISRTF